MYSFTGALVTHVLLFQINFSNQAKDVNQNTESISRALCKLQVQHANVIVVTDFFFRLHLTPKSIAAIAFLVFFFLSFPFLALFLDGLTEKILPMFHILLSTARVTKIRHFSLVTQVNVFVNVFIVKFRICYHDTACTSQKNSNG